MNFMQRPFGNKKLKGETKSKDKEQILSSNSVLDSTNAKILYYHSTGEEEYPIPKLSNQMIVVGPYLNQHNYDYIKTKLHVPEGLVNLETILEKVTDFFEPDILFCWGDTGNNLIQNTQSFKGIKVLLMSDCHHMQKPIEHFLNYTKNERFDFILHGDLRIAPFFRNLNRTRHLWLPCLVVEKRLLDPIQQPLRKIVHVGQTHRFHIKRQQFISSLEKLNMDIDKVSVNQKKVFDIYNKYAVTLNVSLNGDSNMRWIQVMAAGGVLVADKLSKNTGTNRLYSEKEVPTFSSLNEAHSILSRLLVDDDLRYDIALKAQKKYQETFSETIVLEQFWNAINNKKVNKLFDLSSSNTCTKIISYYPDFQNESVILYQVIQECVRISSCTKVDIEGWSKNHFTCLANLQTCQVNYIDETSQETEYSQGHDKYFHDANILVTNRDISKLNLNYDLILQKTDTGNGIPKGYRLLEVNKTFRTFEKTLDIKHKTSVKVNYPFLSQIISHSEKTIGLDSLSSEKTARLLYEKNILKRFSPSQSDLPERKLLLVGAMVETNEWLKNRQVNADYLNLSTLDTITFFDNEAKLYDLIIFFDTSLDLPQLSDKLTSIYGIMNLSTKLLFHSSRFTVGPYGWTNHYPTYGTSDINGGNPWEHMYKVFNLLKEKAFSFSELDELFKTVIKKEYGQIPRSLNYNAETIKKKIFSNGFKILDEQLVSISQKCPFNINFGGMKNDVENSHAVFLAQKANWLEGSLSFF